MAGRTASGVVTKYAGIQVQTSSLGVNIPIGWGVFRCRCNLVDYLDFKAQAQDSGAGGKGGAPTGYTYSATIILAICEGAIEDITQVWVNGKQYAHNSNGSTAVNTGSANAVTQAGLLSDLGAIGTTPWSYLTSHHADHAIGYSGLVTAFQSNYPLDSSASTPNHSFEIVKQAAFAVGGGYTGPDIDPSLMIKDFFENTRTGVPSWRTGLLDSVSLTSAASSYRSYCLAMGLLLAPVIDQQRSASDFLTEVFLATNSTCVWSEGKLKFVPYGDTAATGNGVTFTPNLTPVYALGDDDYAVTEGQNTPPLLVDIEDQSDAYNVVQFEYLDRTNQYNMAIALASDAANIAQFTARRKDPDTVHVICTPAVATISAQLWLQRTLYIRGQYKFNLSWAYALLEPGDIVELTDSTIGLSAYPVRVIEIDEDEKGVLSLICEDLLVGVSHSPLYTMATGLAPQVNQGVDPGGVEANLLLWAGDLTNAAWLNPLGMTITGGVANPITGATDAQLVVPSVTFGIQRIRQQVSPQCFYGANYTYTIDFEAAGYQYVRLNITDSISSGASEVFAEFDVVNGLISTPISALFGASGVSASITSLGAGWYQLSVTGQVVNTGGFILARWLPITTPAPGVATNSLPSWSGNGTSGYNVYGSTLTQGVDIRPFTKTTTTIAGPQIFNPPTALTPGGIETWAAVAGGANWSGADVWVSYDTVNYQLVGSIAGGSARFGQLTASLASHADPDTTNTLSVDLSASNGALTSATQATADAGGTRCLVDSELVCFETATLTNPNRYDLTGYLRRGFLNTIIAAHSSGAEFIRLDDAVFKFPYNASQIGKVASVKFQSINPWGVATPLSQCNAYTIVPVPASGAPPASAAWTAVGTTITNAGVTTPAILISGASDNLSAMAVEFFYRQSGSMTWIADGLNSASTTQKYITSVASGQTYDVAVAYVVNGVLTPLQVIASAITVGTASGGGNGIGTALVNASAAGSGLTATLPSSFTGTHVDIVLTGFPGAGNGVTSGGKGYTYTDRGGGGANVVVVKGFPAVAGDTFTYTLPSAVGSDATVSKTGLSLTAHPGTNATTTTSGTGGVNTGSQTATGSTSVTSYAGHNGGLTDTWDGGGPGATINIASGTVTTPGPDNTTDNSTGAISGQGGAGTYLGANAGGGANLLIIGRA